MAHLRSLIAVALLSLALTPAARPAEETHHAAQRGTGHVSKTAKTKAAKSAPKKGKSASTAPPPGAIPNHPPPPSTTHNQFEVPQAKNLAETPDVVLNSRVRASLFSALTPANAESITAQTANGVVTLTGTVKSSQMRAKAEQAARKIHGVRAVKNLLKVRA